MGLMQFELRQNRWYPSAMCSSGIRCVTMSLGFR